MDDRKATFDENVAAVQAELGCNFLAAVTILALRAQVDALTVSIAEICKQIPAKTDKST